MLSLLNLARNLLPAATVVLSLLRPASAQARNDEILHVFESGADGFEPYGGVVTDEDGNLYGTTIYGGGNCNQPGCGTVFEIASGGAENLLYAFPGLGKGQKGYHEGPWSGVIADEVGNLYGTTVTGGTQNRDCGRGCGMVYKLAPDGTETVLYAFTGRADGNAPYAGLLRDKAGNLYGTTLHGGNYNCQFGCGTVFKIAPDGTETELYAFLGGNDGNYPYAGLIADKAGNLYGTTSAGGSFDGGTVFELTPGGKESLRHDFGANGDGAEPEASLTKDAAGNLYGTTVTGGRGFGTLFEIAPDGTEAVLYAFNGGNDGSGPSDTLIVDKEGVLYGTTVGGGKYRLGTVFKLLPNGNEKVLHAFAGGTDGEKPYSNLILKAGLLYGTTTLGGDSNCGNGQGCGTVFKLRK